MRGTSCKAIVEHWQAESAAADPVNERSSSCDRSGADVIDVPTSACRQDGWHFIRRLRALGTIGALRAAVALTAYARSEDRAAALACGFQRHLAKPVDHTRLVAAVRDVAVNPDAGPATSA